MANDSRSESTVVWAPHERRKGAGSSFLAEVTSLTVFRKKGENELLGEAVGTEVLALIIWKQKLVMEYEEDARTSKQVDIEHEAIEEVVIIFGEGGKDKRHLSETSCSNLTAPRKEKETRRQCRRVARRNRGVCKTGAAKWRRTHWKSRGNSARGQCKDQS